mmetsp:Transcript_85257/g.246474  ORF Transcript_85257/g.246474 Transcript_85257/m.246474 type:complete len:570 (+) Transcript_85257:804-2513(+)
MPARAAPAAAAVARGCGSAVARAGEEDGGRAARAGAAFARNPALVEQRGCGTAAFVPSLGQPAGLRRKSRRLCHLRGVRATMRLGLRPAAHELRWLLHGLGVAVGPQLQPALRELLGNTTLRAPLHRGLLRLHAPRLKGRLVAALGMGVGTLPRRLLGPDGLAGATGLTTKRRAPLGVTGGKVAGGRHLCLPGAPSRGPCRGEADEAPSRAPGGHTKDGRWLPRGSSGAHREGAPGVAVAPRARRGQRRGRGHGRLWRRCTRPAIDGDVGADGHGVLVVAIAGLPMREGRPAAALRRCGAIAARQDGARGVRQSRQQLLPHGQHRRRHAAMALLRRRLLRWQVDVALGSGDGVRRPVSQRHARGRRIDPCEVRRTSLRRLAARGGARGRRRARRGRGDGGRPGRRQAASLEPRRGEDLVEGGAVARVRAEDGGYKLLGRVREGHGVREAVLVVLDPPVRCLDIGGLERRPPDNHRVQHHAKRPDVYLEGVPGLALQDLGSDVVGRAADRALLLAVVLKLRREAEIANLQARVRVEEQVAQLEVAVDDTSAVQVLHRNDEIIQEEHCLGL